MFSAKGHIVNILDFEGCTNSVATAQLCYFSMNADTDHKNTKKHGYFPPPNTLNKKGGSLYLA